LEAALSSSERGIAVAIGSAEIGYDREDRTIDLRGRDVRVRDREQRLLAAFPEIDVRISAGAALRGTVAPTHIVVRDPIFRLRREADGAWLLAMTRSEEPGAELGPELAAGLQPPSDARALSLLQHVSVRGASVLVDDRMLGRSWSARAGTATLSRTEDGVQGGATLVANLGTPETELHLRYRYTRADGHLLCDLNFTDLDPQRIAVLAP